MKKRKGIWVSVMSNIIYKSNVTIPWETQSAFKMKEYHEIAPGRPISSQPLISDACADSAAVQEPSPLPPRK